MGPFQWPIGPWFILCNSRFMQSRNSRIFKFCSTYKFQKKCHKVFLPREILATFFGSFSMTIGPWLILCNTRFMQSRSSRIFKFSVLTNFNFCFKVFFFPPHARLRTKYDFKKCFSMFFFFPFFSPLQQVGRGGFNYSNLSSS